MTPANCGGEKVTIRVQEKSKQKKNLPKSMRELVHDEVVFK